MNRPFFPSGFVDSNYKRPWMPIVTPEFASDRDGDNLITENDFVISARERGWSWAGDECLAFSFIPNEPKRKR
jgi:hypothetical protein